MSDTMTVSLVKGQKVDLTKNNPGLTKVFLAAGWDVGANFDLDIAAIMLDVNGKLAKKENLVFFNNLTSPDGSVMHRGDNLTGVGDGDDEVVDIDLSAVPADVDKIILAINIYQANERRQNFGMVKNAFVRTVNNTDPAKPELNRFDLSEDFSIGTGIEAASIYRHGGEWKFAALGTEFTGTWQNVMDKYKI